MNKKECLIVIASFADGYLDSLLKSIEKNTTDVDYAIQVVDNHTDIEKLSECVIPVCEAHNVPLLTDTEILGYGDALNTGVNVSVVDSEFILYMDSDTLVHKGWLREMIDCYKRHESTGCRMVGPIVKDFNDNYLPGIWDCYGGPEKVCGKDSLLEHSYLIGVCILRKRNDLNKFKWDKNFFRAYCEDDDLSLQVREQGYQIWIAGNALMYHKVNSSHDTMRKKGIIPSQVGASNRGYLNKKWTHINMLKQQGKEIPDTLITGEDIYRTIPEFMK